MVLASRLPQTPLLTHFTRASRNGDALDNLTAILRQGVIRGSSRMIPGRRSTVCFFDLPLSDLRTLLVRQNRRRYEPFGVAIERRYAFCCGARPVIYLPLAEGRRLLAGDELWRLVTLDLGGPREVDWTFEREWRVPDDLPLPTRGAIALVEGWRDVEALYDRFDGFPPCAGVLPLSDIFASPR